MAGPGERPRKKRRPRAREKLSDRIESLCAALTLPQKRTALSMLGGPPTGVRLNDSDEVEQAIESCGRSVGEIVDVLQRIEVTTPKKHFYFATTSGDLKKAIKAAHRYLGHNVADNVALSYVFETDAVFSLVLERTTVGHKWETLANVPGYDAVKGRKTTRVRHPTIVRVETATRRAVLNYPGLPPGIDYDYAVAIKGVLDGVAKLGLHLEGLPMAACVNSVIAAKGRRVLAVRGDLLLPDGVMKMRSKIGKASIQQLVARLVEGSVASEGPGASDVLDVITQNIQKHTLDAIGLLWTDERVLTRVNFVDGGADCLFVWGHADPSFEFVGRMVDLFYQLAASMKSPTFNEIWNVIVEQPNDAILLPAQFRSRFHAPGDEVDSVVVEAVRFGLLAPVYMLSADADVLDEHGLGDWSEELVPLRQVIRDEHSEVVVDGSKPENIRVAFKRVRAKAARQ